ncbi:MAG: RNA polymerase sigma factor [Candidatus Eremiobacteraeota bacterium]|nr:RNA polymerase sigma factor [Candidatus Eremiobacteraeota bacterium]
MNQKNDNKFTAIFEKYHGKVFNLCVRMCRNTSTAHDLTQDTFLKVYQNMDRFRGDSKISTWIYSVATNRCIDHIRRQSSWYNRIRLFFTTPEAYSDNMENQVIDRNTGMQILLKMKPTNRSVLILKQYLGLSYREIADILGMTPGSVGVQLTRARKEAASIARKEGITQ